MAKFLKSFFNTSEKRKISRQENEGEEDKHEEPPLDSRRKLSLSRSGRLKQYNKKRHSLSLELYGENAQNVCSPERPKTLEYHVHEPVSAPADMETESKQRNSTDYNKKKIEVIHSRTLEVERQETNQKCRKLSVDPETLVEEIDSAFEIIEKS